MSTPNAPGDPQSSEPVLGCGRDPAEVLARAVAGRSTDHEQSCPYCQAVITGDGITRRAAAELTQAELQQRVPQTLLPNVMRSVWSDLRRTTMIPLTTDIGSAFIADHTIAAVIESALDRLGALRIHTCTATLASAEPGSDPASSGPGTIAIAVTAAAAYNVDVRVVSGEVRELARRTVAEQFGWTARPIDIDIVDVYLPEDGTP